MTDKDQKAAGRDGPDPVAVRVTRLVERPCVVARGTQGEFGGPNADFWSECVYAPIAYDAPDDSRRARFACLMPSGWLALCGAKMRYLPPG